MTAGTAVDFEPPTGRLVLAPSVLDALVAGDGAALRTSEPALRAAGVRLDGGALHPAVVGVLDTLRRPGVGLVLSYAGREASCRVDGELAVLLLPAGPDGRRPLLRLHPTLLPDAFARAVDLGPRPLPPARCRPADLDVARGVRRWWRLRRDLPDAADLLEVVDTAHGLYRIVDGWAEPATATTVWRHLVRSVVGG